MVKYKLSIPITKARAGKSSLLIPDSWMGYFEDQCNELGNCSAYLSHIVFNYLPRISLIKKEIGRFREPNWNTVYQAKGQNLCKKNFYPGGENWEAMRQAALACGVTICFLFVILMQLEAEGLFKKHKKKQYLGGNSSPDNFKKNEKSGLARRFERILDHQTQILNRIMEIGTG